ncbi:MAG: ABC transporter permease [Candidatus Polarisedimenticolaceae bacterium]|nr:ABC transporter permease [Candidatus Polarisedimenticolaceae bacterium]
MGFRLSLAILLAWALAALFGPLLPLAPNQIELAQILTPPSGSELLGYDDLGRPLLDRLLVGARISFSVAFGVVLIAGSFGVVVGTLSGYFGGLFDLLIMRIIDIFLAFPGILLAIALAGVMGPGIDNLVIALSVVGWVGYARLARSQVLSLKQRDHITAAIALGSSEWIIVTRHLLPLIAAPLIIEATFGIASMVIAEAGLSFLGLGVQPPDASWGSMIRDGARYMLVAPHMVMVPGFAIMLIVFSLNLLGDRLRDKLDVRSNRTE